MTKQISKELQNITKALFSTNDTNVLNAIKQLRSHGNTLIIPVLIEVLVTNKNPDVSNEIYNLLIDLKSDSVIKPLIDIIKEDKVAEYRSLLLSVFWQSALDASEHLSFFIDMAIKGDYMICLECLTVIENLKGPFAEEDIVYSISVIHECLETRSDKNELLISILEALQRQ